MWSVGELYGVSEGDYSLVNRKYQFEIEETLYAFLTQDFATTSKCIVNFDILNRRVNVTPVEYIGNDTGIVLAYDSLVRQLDIATEEDRLATRLRVVGGDDMEITRVNFGSNLVDDLFYKMNAKDLNGNRIYVSDALAAKYEDYKEYRETQREEYIQLSKEYESYADQISEIKNRVPNDNLRNDWGTFSLDELKAANTSFKNLLATLKSLYKEEYGNLGLNPDGSINENFIKTTPYWWDYDAYNNILVEIECAIAVFPYYDDTSHWTDAQKHQYEDAIKAWETDWSLFGTDELQAKISTYQQNMNLMLEEPSSDDPDESKSAVIRKYSAGYEIKTWNELTAAEKESYANNSELYHYDLYMEYYDNAESAQDYLDDLLDEIATLEELQAQTQTDRQEIVSDVAYESYFTEDECKIIYKLFRDSDYSNENILTTSIDTSSEKIDHMYELLQDAQNKVSETSRPQLTFSVEADNLLSLVDFEPLWDSFFCGNYLMVQYQDDVYVRLRLLGFTFNPCLPSSNDLRIEFSNFTRSKSEYNDWDNLLGQSDGGTSSSSGGSGKGGSGSGAYGESDDIDITISNTMLAKLLNTEMFGSRVTDVILDTMDLNKLFARTATFGGLANGTTTIDGKCIITGYIADQYYNGTNGAINNTEGSIINLETGKFNFGGGKILYDGSALNIIVDELYIGTQNVEETIETIEDELGNIFNLSIETSYTATTVKYTATLLHNGEDISNQEGVRQDFDWYSKTTNDLTYLGSGRQIAIPKDSMIYGQSVLLTWSDRSYVDMADLNGDYIADKDGNQFSVRTTTGVSMKAETSVFDDNLLGRDIAELIQTSYSLTSRIQNAEGDISTLEQTATSIEARVEDAEGDISELELTAGEFDLRITSNSDDIDTLQGQVTGAIDELGNIYELSISLSYTTTQITYTASLIQNGIDISNQGDYKHDFVWFSKNKDELIYIGEGRSITVNIDSLSYGQSVMVEWTQREFSDLADGSGNILQLVNNNTLEVRGSSSKGLVLRAETSVFDDESLGYDMSELRVTAEELTSRISDAEGNISVLEQTAQGFQTTVRSNVANAGAIAYDSEGNAYRMTTDTTYTDSAIVYTATLIKNGRNISDFDEIKNDFNWYAKTVDQYTFIGTGRSISVPLTEINYGMIVVCEWDQREYAEALLNNNNSLTTKDGYNILLRTDFDNIVA